MANSDSSKTCQADDNACKRDAQALCFHCSKNLCRIHLLQHAQLIEEKTRTELNLLADKFNELSSRFDHTPISSDILKKPFDQLEKWRVEAHKKIDQIVENKRDEINDKIEEYRIVFATKNDEQIKKINANKKVIVELIQEADASRKQMDDLQAVINEAEKYLETLTTHKINVINPSPICYVNIDTQFFDCQSLSNDELREFKITYIRLNGTIRNYYVKTKKNGTMRNLKNSFVMKYDLLEELTRVELNSSHTIDHQPKLDFILPAQVYDHLVRLQYDNNSELTSILENDKIVFYETPYSIAAQDSSRILMPCLFKRLPMKQRFALPIYLNVPRHGCLGQDVLEPLHNILGTFFSLDPNTNHNLYNATLVFNRPGQYRQTWKALNDALDDQLNFNKINVSLEVDIDSEIADIYENKL